MKRVNINYSLYCVLFLRGKLQCDRMNKAFGGIIGREPRLKETPFVFGGNMVIHRNLFTVVPFDPVVTIGAEG